VRLQTASVEDVSVGWVVEGIRLRDGKLVAV